MLATNEYSISILLTNNRIYGHLNWIRFQYSYSKNPIIFAAHSKRVAFFLQKRIFLTKMVKPSRLHHVYREIDYG